MDLFALADESFHGSYRRQTVDLFALADLSFHSRYRRQTVDLFALAAQSFHSSYRRQTVDLFALANQSFHSSYRRQTVDLFALADESFHALASVATVFRTLNCGQSSYEKRFMTGGTPIPHEAGPLSDPELTFDSCQAVFEGFDALQQRLSLGIGNRRFDRLGFFGVGSEAAIGNG